MRYGPYGMHRSINRRRATGRSQAARLEDLEDELRASMEPDKTATTVLLLSLEGDDFERYKRWVHDELHFFLEAEAAGVYVLGDRFPRFLTGTWHLDAEWQARLEALAAEYRYLVSAAEAQQLERERAKQEH